MSSAVLKNKWIEMKILDYGAIIQNINAFGYDITLGFDNISDYIDDDCCFGSAVGRTANRCKGDNYIDGKKYSLSLNENGTTHLHGGFSGFGKKTFKIEEKNDSSILLSCFSEDGEEGYPGNLKAFVRYTLKDNFILIEYYAMTDKPTWVCLTNHTYFNPDGAGSGDIFGGKVKIDADRVSLYDDKMRTNGRTDVNSIFDFRNEKILGREFDCNYFLNLKKGADFCGRKLYFAASVTGKIKISVWTDMPCMQFYTGNFIKDNTGIANGKTVSRNGALCFETQFEPGFQSKGEHILRPDVLYSRATAFVFDKET